MQYRPEHTDLLEAIQEFLLKDILPFVKEKDMLAYKTLVSWNMLGVVARELKNARPLLEEDARALARIVGTEVNPPALADNELYQSAQRLAKAAAQKLRATKALPGSTEWSAVKEIVKHNLQIANPRFGAE